MVATTRTQLPAPRTGQHVHRERMAQGAAARPVFGEECGRQTRYAAARGGGADALRRGISDSLSALSHGRRTLPSDRGLPSDLARAFHVLHGVACTPRGVGDVAARPVVE